MCNLYISIKACKNAWKVHGARWPYKLTQCTNNMWSSVYNNTDIVVWVLLLVFIFVLGFNTLLYSPGLGTISLPGLKQLKTMLF